MAETQRIQYLVATHGEAVAKQKCLEICETYQGYLDGKHGRKMEMFWNKMRESIVELQNFINT